MTKKNTKKPALKSSKKQSKKTQTIQRTDADDADKIVAILGVICETSTVEITKEGKEWMVRIGCLDDILDERLLPCLQFAHERSKKLK